MSALVHLMTAPPTPSPSPTPTMTAGPGIGDTVNLAAPWQWTLPLTITCVLGALTVFGVAFTVWQKHRSDQRQQLWNRMQWALNAMTASNEEARSVGAMAVSHLAGTAGKMTRKQRRDAKKAHKKDPENNPMIPRPPAKLSGYDIELLDTALESLDK